MKDEDEDVDTVRPRLDEDAEELIAKLVGVATSDSDEIDGGSAGTGVKGCKGERGATESIGEIDGGIVLIRPMDDGEPLGLRIEVSKDTSTPS